MSIVAFFTFYLLSLIMGSTAILFCTFLYFENRNSFIKYFIIILLIEFFYNIHNFILLFYKINESLYFTFVSATSNFLEFLVLGIFIFDIIKIKYKKIKMTVIAFLLTLAFVSQISEEILEKTSFFIIFKHMRFFYFIVVSYYLYLAIISRLKEKNRDIKLLLSVLIVAFLSAIPLAIIRETFLSEIVYFNHMEDSIIYFILTIGGFVYLFRKMSLKMEIKKETENNEIVPTVNEEAQKEFFTEKISLSNVALTQREMEVTGLILDGLSNQQIADALFISIKTVKTHIYNIYQKLDIKNRTELTYRFKK